MKSIMACVFVWFAVLLSFPQHQLFASEKYPELSASDRDAFTKQVQDLVKAEGTRVHNFLMSLQNGDVLMTDALRVQGEHGVNLLQVKETLAYNFLNSPSIKSPLVRAKLLAVLKKDDISPADITDLQNTVVSERPRTEP